MLHHSLSTLTKQSTKLSFDVVVFMCCDDKNFDLLNYNHLDNFNLVKDFPNVKFFKSDYDETDAWMSKWYHMQKTFEIGYEKVFYIDCDTIFFDNPSPLFELESGSMYCLLEVSSHVNDLILKQKGINSGHIVLDRKVYEKIFNFFPSLKIKRQQLIDQAKDLYELGIINKQEFQHFTYFSEQYCAQMCMKDNDIELKLLDSHQINWGGSDRTIEYDHHGPVKIYPRPGIVLHYTTAGAHMYLPFAYHTQYHKQQWEAYEKTLVWGEGGNRTLAP